MTDEMMQLRALVEKNPDADILREMIGFTAQWLMELEVGGLTGAAHGEESAEQLGQRNGYRDRDWETRVGTADCAFPNSGRVPTVSNRGDLIPPTMLEQIFEHSSEEPTSRPIRDRGWASISHARSHHRMGALQRGIYTTGNPLYVPDARPH